MIKIYLAGGLNTGWQDEILGIGGDYTYIDPRAWQSGATPEQYTTRDLAAIEDSHWVIAYMDSKNPSGFGLSVEIGYAKALRKKIIFVDLMKNDYRSRYFDMHRCMCDHIVYTIAELKSWMSHPQF